MVPVPPLVVPKVPASVMAPVLAVDGVSPLNEVWNDVTPVLVNVIAPALFVTLIPVPAVSVAKVNPVPLPIRS